MKLETAIFGRCVVGIFLGMFVLLLLLALLCPAAHSAYADELTTEALSKVQANVSSAVSVALASNVNIDVVPKSTGNYALSSAKLKVATNSTSGYSVYLRSGTDSNALKNLDLSVNSEIKATTKTAPLAEIDDNSWGYSLSKSEIDETATFTAVPLETGSAVISVDNLSNPDLGGIDDYNLAFGAKLNLTTPSGSYANSVVISVVANPLTVTSLNQLIYMQDITSDICANTAIGTNKQLIDTRDGQSYWVTKLEDQNCWMTQNLALNLSTNKTLTPADSDVSSNYTPTSNTNDLALTGSLVSGSSLSSQYSWNMGKIALALPLYGRGCSVYGETKDLHSAKTTDNLGAVCGNVGFVDVSGQDWTPTYQAQAGIYNNQEHPLVAVDQVGKSYDAHYLIGNYYQYNTATAGTGAALTTTSAGATSSICPKGWMLPTATAGNGFLPLYTPGSFYGLLYSYGYPESSNYSVDVNNRADTGILNRGVNAESNIAAHPIALVRSGFMSLGSGYLYAAGGHGTLWSQNTQNQSEANANYITDALVYPTYNYFKSNGYPVRCLAR